MQHEKEIGGDETGVDNHFDRERKNGATGFVFHTHPKQMLFGAAAYVAARLSPVNEEN
jgi:hypothetical protein